MVAPTATPLESPTPEPTATLPPNQTIHTVKSGETIINIAKDYGTTASAVLKANKMKASDPIHAGDQLIIPLPAARTPTPTPSPTPTPTPVVYVVKTGDTLSDIARTYGTTVELLMKANGLTSATNIHAGSRLTVVKPSDLAANMVYETYTVLKTDTLSSIAARFNVAADKIKEASKLTSDQLSSGQKLKIPVGTATPTPTSTPVDTATPTPAWPYAAPALLGPADSAAFEGDSTPILLNWASVGILAEDDWYVVRIRRSGSITEQLPLVWTKVTSWQLPSDLYIAGVAQPQQFDWQVVVMRQTGVAVDGTRFGEEISPRGGSRTFTWK